jgi:hypothetical protein
MSKQCSAGEEEQKLRYLAGSGTDSRGLEEVTLFVSITMMLLHHLFAESRSSDASGRLLGGLLCAQGHNSVVLVRLTRVRVSVSLFA